MYTYEILKAMYGTLSKIQEKDASKIIECKEREIELHSIDTSRQSPFKPETSKVFLDEILNIISEKLKCQQ